MPGPRAWLQNYKTIIMLYKLENMNIPQLPLTRHISPVYSTSLFVAVLMAAASLAGLLFPMLMYPTDELRRAFLSNDVVNLFIGLPILLGSMWLTRRGSLFGLLFWPGALFYTTYNYLAYAVAMPFTLPFLVNLALVILSVYMIYNLLSSMDATLLQAQLKGSVSERYIGATLAGFGALFFLMAVGKVASFFTGQAALPWAELSVQITDLLITPAWIVGGILLWKKHAFGYLTGLGLLFQASMLFVGLLIFFILQPVVAGVSFPIGDFVVIAVMSLFCLIPFGLFLRGIVSTGK